jgi:hypothetical protein
MTDIPGIEHLVGSLRESITAPEKAELVTQIANDAARLVSLALTDKEAAAAESAHLQAQLLNLTSAEINATVELVSEWGKTAMENAIKLALPV